MLVALGVLYLPVHFIIVIIIIIFVDVVAVIIVLILILLLISFLLFQLAEFLSRVVYCSYEVS